MLTHIIVVLINITFIIFSVVYIRTPIEYKNEVVGKLIEYRTRFDISSYYYYGIYEYFVDGVSYIYRSKVRRSNKCFVDDTTVLKYRNESPSKPVEVNYSNIVVFLIFIVIIDILTFISFIDIVK